jgi:hypothetical protein
MNVFMAAKSALARLAIEENGANRDLDLIHQGRGARRFAAAVGQDGDDFA